MLSVQQVFFNIPRAKGCYPQIRANQRRQLHDSVQVEFRHSSFCYCVLPRAQALSSALDSTRPWTRQISFRAVESTKQAHSVTKAAPLTFLSCDGDDTC